MSKPIFIYRSTSIHLTASLISCGYFILFTIMMYQIADFEKWLTPLGIGYIVFSSLFVLFAGIYAIYLAFSKEPYLGIHSTYVEISSNVAPKLKFKILISDILNIDTNWVKGGGDQRSDIIFHVKEMAFESLSKSKRWRRRDKKANILYWPFMNADLSPAEAVQIIKDHLTTETA